MANFTYRTYTDLHGLYCMFSLKKNYLTFFFFFKSSGILKAAWTDISGVGHVTTFVADSACKYFFFFFFFFFLSILVEVELTFPTFNSE